MTPDEITEFAARQALRMKTGDMDALLSRFDMPLPIFGPVSMSVLTSKAVLQRTFECYRRTLDVLGVLELKPCRVVIEDRSNRRCLARIDWDHFDAEGTCLCTSTARNILRFDPADPEPMVELVEYVVSSFPHVLEKIEHELTH